MTEAEWLKCDDPLKMLMWLRTQGRVPRFKSGRRKLRLFASACCRRLWDHLPNDACRRAVEINERHADGLAAKADLVAAWEATENQVRELETNLPLAPPREQKRLLTPLFLNRMVNWALHERAWLAAVPTSNTAVDSAALLAAGHPGIGSSTFAKALPVERRAQSDLLRDIFGNPFGPSTVQAAWLTWNDRTIPRIARAIYDDRAFDRLVILADALEDAGCSDTAILAHRREPGEHVRGCWLLDLLLHQG
jgi:hypothetical protein